MNPLLLFIAQSGILAYFLAMNLAQLWIMFRSFFAIRTYLDVTEADRIEDILGTSHYLPITVICPMYNEAEGAVANVRSLLSLRYNDIQVLVVNDGSTDQTLERLVEAFHLRPSQRVVRRLLPMQPVRGIYESIYTTNLLVVDKANGGKSDALNCGLNLARYPLVCCIDGDSLLENDALLRMVRPFLDDPRTVACGGVIRPLNGCKVTPVGIRGMSLPANWLARFQVVEYLRAFLYGRVGLASFGSLFVLSGAFALFRKETLLQCGGFAAGTVGEDFEMIVRIHHRLRKEGRPYRVTMVPDPICWTEVPERWKTLARQRNRWQRGLLETLWEHRAMWFNPRYGRIGLFSMPYFLLFEALAPLIELGGYALFLWFALTGSINSAFALLFLWLALFLGLLNSLVGVILEVHMTHRYPGLKSILGLFGISLLENFGFRQLTLWWRLRGWVDFLRGKRHWGHMERKGIRETTD